MKLKFKHQPFQKDAALAVRDIFEGQQSFAGAFGYKMDVGDGYMQGLDEGWKNAEINPEVASKLLERIQLVQSKNGIKPSEILEGEGINLTVEMETGVGKTYTYLKTIHELYRKYGWMKYIVVVPSIAIREGVYKSFIDLEEHFMEDYGVHKSVFVYDSSHLSKIESFAKDAGIQVMIINSQAFAKNFDEEKGDKTARIIYTKQDSMSGRRPIDVLASLRPIIIIDEPQSVEGAATVAALKKFNPLFTLRYSATHKNLYNLVYRLDAIDALRQKLVKKIAVKGITRTGTTATRGYIAIKAINAYEDKNPDAEIIFDKAMKQGVKRVSVKHADKGFDIYENSGNLAEYDPKQHGAFAIAEIDAKEGYVEFRNGVRLRVGEVNGEENEEELRRIQIRETIRAHLQQEEKLFGRGIKCLSLFFIDEVAKYRMYGPDGAIKGQYAKIFEEEYEKARQERLEVLPGLRNKEYEEWLERQSAADCHNGYFSIDKQGHFTDPKIERGGRRGGEGGVSGDVGAFNLIMKGREKLLGFDDPEGGKIRFIFSHSALREGWDNPNVFQICTLKQSGDYIRKRQEVGRGLRLCVNKNGERQDASVLGAGIYDVNTLTVIASESYESFARDLQRAIIENVGDRPRKVDMEIFKGVDYETSDGKKCRIDDDVARKIYNRLVKCEYVDDEGKLTEKFEQDRNSGAFSLGENVEVDTKTILQVLGRVIGKEDLRIENDDNTLRQQFVYERFKSKEFQELWRKINAKSAYTVTFDSEDLIRKSVDALNAKLRVRDLEFEVKTGMMKENADRESIEAHSAMELTAGGTSYQKVEFAIDKSYRCDLIGEIVEATDLTRRDVAHILVGIDKNVFAQFRRNPEEFIRKASLLIKEQMSNVIIEHITYNKTDETFKENIFSESRLKGYPGRRVVKNSVKGVYDMFVLDSNVEEEFCRELESYKNVVVYTKLPNSFFIDTPVGKYNPDWAIVFDTEGQRHLYFIAETKGSVEEFSLKKIEEAKIECARRHFAAIAPSEVKYGVVSTLDELREIMTMK